MRVRDGKVTIRPIAGTRPRGATPGEDRALAAELLADPKERAEHLMLLDLGRNDVGRVAEIGSIKVTDQFILEYYSQVMHIVSNVEARLDRKYDAIDALTAGFPAGMTRAKWPTHYFAASSITGKPRVLFFTGYDSFEAWEKDVQATQKNATLSAALDRAGVADGELLSDSDSTALVYSDEYSLRSAVDIAHMRYFEISLYRVRPGHDADWNTIVKMVKAAYEKMPDVHWAAYQLSMVRRATPTSSSRP